MSRLYEAMFLIDNDTVRASWQQAKASVAGLVEKHGGTVCTARRWGERRLAYPIHRRNRATYLLTYLELVPEQIPELHRDLEINDMVLRHLMMRTAEVPAEEVELAKAESADDFVVPEPPADDAIDEPEAPETAEAAAPVTPSEGAPADTAAADAPEAATEAPEAATEATGETATEEVAEAAPEETTEDVPAPAAEDAATTETEESTDDEPEKTEG